MKESRQPAGNAALRRKAREKLRQQTDRLSELSSKDMKHLITELGTHQIELEMQNEELRRAQSELEASRGKYAGLYDFAPVGYFTLNARGLILEVNQTGSDLLGIGKRLLINKPFSLFLAEEADRRAFRAHLEDVFFKQTHRTCEVSLKKKKGPPFHAQVQSVTTGNISGEAGTVRVTVTDITERKKEEEELQQSLRRFELLAHTAGELLQAPEPQKVVESLCGKVMEHLDCDVFFNFLVDENAGKLHLNAYAGIPEEEAKRIEWLDFGVAVCGCVVRDGARIVAHHILTTPDERTELLKSYGIKALACHPLLGLGGKVIGTLALGTRGRETFSEEDLSLMKAVTDQVAVAMARMRNESEVLKLSEDMAARNVELETLNKELESFVYSVSHDLRAPIRSVSEFSRIVAEDYADKLDEQGKDYLARVSKGAGKMNRLIEDLLYLSRITRQQMARREVDLAKMAASVVAELGEAHRGRTVVVDIKEGLSAFADPRLMEVALSNLFGNAWKFTAKTENARVEFGSVEREGKTVYHIKDNGAGFDPEYADKMFWPFHRLHSENEFEGTGIGLAIVERIIRRHGGRAWAEGECGKGATVYFTLG